MASHLDFDKEKRRSKARSLHLLMSEKKHAKAVARRLAWQKALAKHGWKTCTRCGGGVHPMSGICHKCRLADPKNKAVQRFKSNAKTTHQCAGCLKPVDRKFTYCYSCHQGRRRLAYDDK